MSPATPRTPRIRFPALVQLPSLPRHRRPSQSEPGARAVSPRTSYLAGALAVVAVGARWVTCLGIRANDVVGRPFPIPPRRIDGVQNETSRRHIHCCILDPCRRRPPRPPGFASLPSCSYPPSLGTADVASQSQTHEQSVP